MFVYFITFDRLVGNLPFFVPPWSAFNISWLQRIRGLAMQPCGGRRRHGGHPHRLGDVSRVPLCMPDVIFLAGHALADLPPCRRFSALRV